MNLASLCGGGYGHTMVSQGWEAQDWDRSLITLLPSEKDLRLGVAVRTGVKTAVDNEWMELQPGHGGMYL